jgi:hypothetical protein
MKDVSSTVKDNLDRFNQRVDVTVVKFGSGLNSSPLSTTLIAENESINYNGNRTKENDIT